MICVNYVFMDVVLYIKFDIGYKKPWITDPEKQGFDAVEI